MVADPDIVATAAACRAHLATIITIVTLIFFTLLIFGIDWVFSEAVLKLFNA